MPAIDLNAIGGGTVSLGESGRWKVVVVYRGKHCPLCKPYLNTLQGLKAGFEELGAEVIAVSADPKEKAEADVAEHGWDFGVGYDLSQEQMHALGLYVSEPRSEKETDRPFSEPGFFLVRPDGRVQIVDISNAPFARTNLAPLVGNLKWIQENDYPIRGTAG
jgi:peroxiredoxin